MKYVLDASVAVKLVLPEHDSPKALAPTDMMIQWLPGKRTPSVASPRVD